MTYAHDISLGLETVPEIPNPIELPVTGKLPSYLSKSTLYRNGPGIFSTTHKDGEPYEVRHWFDGLGIVHAFAIDAGANVVQYRSRHIASSLLRTIQATPKDRYSRCTFGSADPCRSLLGKFMQMFSSSPIDPKTGLAPTGNVNVTIQEIPGKGPVVARTDSVNSTVLNAETLEAEEFFNFSSMDPELTGHFSASHGHFDEDTGEFFNYTFALGASSTVKYNVFRVKKSGEVEIMVQFTEKPYYLHSFATTENYVILCLWPCHVSGLKLLYHKNVLNSFSFDKSQETKFIVVSRSENKVVASYTSSAFFCFHIINAFERDDQIHIDLCEYEDIQIMEDLMLDNLRSGNVVAGRCVTRYTLENLSAAIAGGVATPGNVVRSMLCDKAFEMPRTHPALRRKDYRYVYGVVDAPDKLFGLVGKLDITTGKMTTWSIPRGVVGEPIFVPDPAGTTEDEGVLLVVVLDAAIEKSMMVVIDAQTMQERARAVVPQVVPLGSHGKFDISV